MNQIQPPSPSPRNGAQCREAPNAAGDILALSRIPRSLEEAIPASARNREPLPPAGQLEPEEVGAAAVKGFAYRALAQIIENYWREILMWRAKNASSCGLVVPGDPAPQNSSIASLLLELKEGASALNPGAISMNLMSRVKRVTATFARPPHSESWLERAQDQESHALAQHLLYQPVELRLVAGLNSAFARTFELQAELLNALSEAARGNNPTYANAAISVLTSPQALTRHTEDLHRLLKYASSLQFDHFRLLNDWLREQSGPSRAFHFYCTEENPEGVIGFRRDSLAELHASFSKCTPHSARHGCPASQARTAPAPGKEMRSVMAQTFVWIEEINAAFLFPLVAELYSRQAPPMGSL